MDMPTPDPSVEQGARDMAAHLIAKGALPLLVLGILSDGRYMVLTPGGNDIKQSRELLREAFDLLKLAGLL